LHLEDLLSRFTVLTHSDPMLSFALIIVILFLGYWRPKLVLSVVLLALLVAGVYYVTMSMAASGTGIKQRMISEGVGRLEEFQR